MLDFRDPIDHRKPHVWICEPQICESIDYSSVLLIFVGNIDITIT